MGNEHWVECTLGDLCRPKQWKTISTSELLEKGYPVYGANGKIGFYNEFNHKEPTILVTCRGATCGKVNISDPFSYINGNAMALDDLKSEIAFSFLSFFLQNRSFNDTITGSAQPQIIRSAIEKIRIPLPPLNEQKRIVEKLDAILPKVKQAKERLEKISTMLKKFRQSILAAACSGKLTEEWRKGKDLPEWEEEMIGNVITSLNYGTSKKCDYSIKNGIPVLRIPNVSSGKLTLDDLKFAALDKKEQSYYSLESGDLLMIRSNGSVSLLGLSVVADDLVVGYAYAGYLICLKCNKQFMVPNFLHLVLSSSELRTQIELPARSTTGVHNINSEEIKSLVVPLPPLTEQQEIVFRVEKFFAAADALEEKYQSAMRQINKIEQAVLAKAFRGELAGTDPNDEPAEELLKRILKEKAMSKRKS
jgi:type I restriction enzyme S subunit